jgi:hypothetical protein
MKIIVDNSNTIFRLEHDASEEKGVFLAATIPAPLQATPGMLSSSHYFDIRL